MASDRSQSSIIRIPPFQYIHVLDNNLNTTRVEAGPKTFTRQDHEKIVFGPEPMVRLPPRHYCKVADPAIFVEGKPETDQYGLIKLRHGDLEIRTAEKWSEPFVLYPGERLIGSIEQLQVVRYNSALRIQATRDLVDDEGNHRVAGDEWLFKGPGTYIPRVEAEVLETVSTIVIKHNAALRLRARKECKDSKGVVRKAGEEWLIREQGSYLPEVDEEVVGEVRATVLTEKTALQLRATKTFTDIYSVTRKAGEEWLVTFQMAETHIQDVYEEVVGEIPRIALTNRQYCVVLDPVGADGKNQCGVKELRKGEMTFFLKPGESLEHGTQEVEVLGEEEALLLCARERFTEHESKEERMPGEKWLLHGPCDYVPPVEVEILERRHNIPLDVNEGIYVRDTKTGAVRAVTGQTYMLQATETFWEKELPQSVEDLLVMQALGDVYVAPEDPNEHVKLQSNRDKTRVVTFRAPHNSAVQIYDYKEKTSRVVFGPGLVMLGPDEQFTIISLSGGKPKRPNMIRTLALMLGPDFMTDVVIVETSDHARLSLQLAYNWMFEVDQKDPASWQKLFAVRDFTGDACKAIASRVRGAVASVTFEDFHKHSSKIIRGSVFGVQDGKVGDQLRFDANDLLITNVDIQSVEPVDQRTRDSLQKSVQLAIEITTKSQEATARHEAERLEQEAKGRLERQKINDQADAEAARKKLLELQAESSAVETSGQATAEARARAEASTIECESQLKQSEIRSRASKIEAQAEIETSSAKQAADIEHRKAMDDLEVTKARELAAIEAQKFKNTVEAVGRETIVSMARAGPEMQAKLLSGLGLQGYLISDSKSPINLFTTASGMISPPALPQ